MKIIEDPTPVPADIGCLVFYAEARPVLERLDPLRENLFPKEQTRIIHLLVDRVDIWTGGADVRLKLEGLASLARDLAAPSLGWAKAGA